MRVRDVEQMVNSYEGSQDYGIPFGVVLVYRDGRGTFHRSGCCTLCGINKATAGVYSEHRQRDGAVSDGQGLHRVDRQYCQRLRRTVTYRYP